MALKQLNEFAKVQSEKKTLDYLMIDVPYPLFLNKNGRVVVLLEKGGAFLELVTHKNRSVCNTNKSISENSLAVYIGLCDPGGQFIHHDIEIDGRRSHLNPLNLHLEIQITKPFEITQYDNEFEISDPVIWLDEVSKFGNLFSSGIVSNCPYWLIVNKSEREKYTLCSYDENAYENNGRKALFLAYNRNR